MSVSTRRLVIALVAILTIGCDRVTKQVALATLAGQSDRTLLADTVRLTYAENTGAFLSLGSGLPPQVRTALFTVVTAVSIGSFLLFALRRRVNAIGALGLTLFIAGALSNWLDRLLRGSVVDFMIVGVGALRTGVFNVADVAIMAGVCLFLAGEMRSPSLPNDGRRGSPA